MILGSGPNRIGQGVEFDYCCVHAAFALSDAGFETVMVNCNPETVSTDYDTSDRLFFEPLSIEGVPQRVPTRCRRRRASCAGVDRGARWPDAAEARPRARATPGIPVAGHEPGRRSTSPRTATGSTRCATGSSIPQPPGGTATTADAAQAIAAGIGFPVLVRPSYVLGGRAMQIVSTPRGSTRRWTSSPPQGSLGREGGLSAERPALIDRFLEDAIEVDVDALRDATGEVSSAGSWSTSRRPACTPATPRA